MGLDPNDIHLRIEADVSAPGAEQAAQQIRGAGQAADQTRASFDRLRQTGGQGGAQQVVAAPPVNPASAGGGRDALANELVRQLVQQRQATEEVFRNAVESVRQSTGVRPTITPEALGIAPAPAQVAANGAEGGGRGGGGRGRGGGFEDAGDGARQVRQEVEALDEPLQRAQRGASGLAGLFNLSGQSLTRASLALVGVGAGLNALVTIANRVHSEILAAVDAQVELAQRSRELAADYGPQGGGQFAARAAAFTANPQTRGSEQDYLAAAASLHQLTAEYGLNNDQVDRLTTAAGQLARVHNTELAPAVQALQGVLRGNVDAAQAYGISLTDEYGRIRGIGATYDQLVATVGRARAEQILYAQVLQQTGQQQQNASQSVDSTATSLDRLQKAATLARQELASLTEKPFNVIVNIAARLAEGTPQAAETTGALVAASPIGQGVSAVQEANQSMQQIGQFASNARSQVAQGNPALGRAVDILSAILGIPTPERTAREIPRPDTASAAGVEQAANASTQLAQSAASTTNALSGVGTAFEQLSSKLQGDLLPVLQRLSSTQTSISGLGTIGQALQGPDQLTGGDIRGRGAVAAAQDVLAQQRLRDAQSAGGVVAQAGQIDPNEFARRSAARTAELQGQQAQTFAGRAQQEAQAGVSALDLVDQQRQLDAAGQLANLRTETLNREGNIVDLQRQEADLADQMRVTNRENLDLLERQTQARLDSLGASNRLNDVQFATQRDQLQIQATRADVRRGALDPSALQDIPAIRQRLRDEMLATPRAQLDALTAGRPAELAGRAVQQDQLQRALADVPLQRQQRGLEDQVTPLQEQQRLTDQRTQSINRQLDLARAAEEPQRTAAERNVLAATAVALAADQSVRSAQEWAAGIHDGLTDLERAWGLAQQATGTGTFPNPTPDRQPGAQSGQIGTPTGPLGTGTLPSPATARSAAADTAGQAVILAGGSVTQASDAASRAYAGESAARAVGDTFNITIQVGGSNASPQEIGNAVLAAISRRGPRAPRAAPSSLVGVR